MSDFVGTLREQLVGAAERERSRRLPRVGPPSAKLVLAAVAAAAMILIVALAAGALDPRPTDDARPAETPTPQARDLFGGTLEPGVRYRTTEFVPRLEFVVDDDQWSAVDTTLPAELRLARVTRGAPQPERIQQLLFVRVPAVFDPGVRGLDAARRAAPEDLHAWLARHPDLRVGPARPVTVAGVPGERFALRAAFDRPAHADPWCRRFEQFSCSLVAPGLNLPDGMLGRVVVLRTEPEPLVIVTGGLSKPDLEAAEAASKPVLESLEIP